MTDFEYLAAAARGEPLPEEPTPGVEMTEQVGADAPAPIGHNSKSIALDEFLRHHEEAERLGKASIESRMKAAQALWQHRQDFNHGDWQAEAESLPCSRRHVTNYLQVGEYLSQIGTDCQFDDFTSLLRAAADWRAERDAEVARKAAEERRKAEEDAKREAEERRRKVDEAQREAHEAAWEDQGRMNELADQEAALAMKAEQDLERARERTQKAEERAAAKQARVDRRRELQAELGEDGDTKPSGTKYSGASSNEHYTPRYIVEAAIAVMGPIDLDPASCEEGQDVIQAVRYFCEADDGLSQPWSGAVWLNPPYSNRDLEAWVGKLLRHVDAGDVTQACLLLHASTDTRYGQMALGGCAAACFHAGRVKFEGPNAGKGGAQIGQMICYYGPYPERFARTFSEMGTVVLPWRDPP